MRELLGALAVKPPADFPAFVPRDARIVNVEEIPEGDRAAIRTWAASEGCSERLLEFGQQGTEFIPTGEVTAGLSDDVQGTRYLLIPGGVL